MMKCGEAIDLLLISGWDITMQFLYSHCGTARNELVDKYVDASLPGLYNCQHTAAIPFAAFKAEVKRCSRNEFKDTLGQINRTVDL
jgi:hypothetical protein